MLSYRFAPIQPPSKWSHDNRYDRFDWMQNREKIITDPDYEYSLNGGFHRTLVQNKTMIWTCNPDLIKFGLPPYLQCINFAIHGEPEIPSFIPKRAGLSMKQFISTYSHHILDPIKQHELAVLYNITVDFYEDRAIERGRELKYIFTLGVPTPDSKNIGLLSILRNDGQKTNHFALLLPDRENCLPLVQNYIYCNTCGYYIYFKKKQGWMKHIRECTKCNTCGKTCKRGDGHITNCNAQHWKKSKRTKSGCIRIYEKEPPEVERLDLSEQYFADFETLTPDGEQTYKVYAGGYIDGIEVPYRTKEEPDTIQYKWQNESWAKIHYGPRSMDDFMTEIIAKCAGTMWFFNGSRFDNFFIFKWLLRRRVRIDTRSLLINGNNLLSIKFKTRRGWLQLKDLSKFLNGSLDDCCKSFGLPEDKSKTDFDHNKMKTWEDVEEHRKECCEYLKMDVISLRELFKIFAKTMFGLYRINVAKYMTITQIAYAAWTSNLPENMRKNLFKTPVGKSEKVMREMYKGGRVLCGRKEWKSHFFEECLKKRKKWWDPELLKKDPDAHLLAQHEGYCISQELYDKITDYLVFSDVNSLYPAVQISTKYPFKIVKKANSKGVLEEKWDNIPTEALSQFPYGKHNIVQYEPNSRDEQQLILEINDRHRVSREKWMRMGACVDVTCPKDLSVAFLMTRKEAKNKKDKFKTEVVQDLNDKVKQWYTGPELWEATKLGYQITRIYSTCEWEKSSSLFQEFVEKTYAIKAAQDSDGPMRACAKALLNGLTGKFGQKNIQRNVVILKVGDPITDDIVDITAIEDELGNLIGYYGFIEKEFETSGFPIELSSWILSLARIYMSKILRKMNIERGLWDPEEEKISYEESPFYSDTDSLVLHIRSWQRLHPDLKGNKALGQLKLEIEGKIISFSCLANKTWSITYIDEKTKRILSITKTKGIPHKGLYYETCRFYTCSELEERNAMVASGYFTPEEALEEEIPESWFEDSKKETEFKNKISMQSDFLTQRREHKIPSFIHTPESVNIKSRAYVFKKDGKPLFICRKIPPLFLDKILTREWAMECIFGGMVRQFKPGNLAELFIAPETKSRTLCMTDWWAQEKRVESPWENDLLFRPAYPRGHYMVTEEESDG